MTHLLYRSDIDGLRALAVIPVILFHAGASWMPGGFVGVDIFFVISGYLISSNILREMQAGEFSFPRFYERRLRRIIPALLVMLLLSVSVFQAIALPDQAQGAAASGIAALLSLSNFYFWRESGYFAASAELMPLLHTWSLAVEEQFYLIFPVILLAICKLRLPMKWMIVTGTMAAFAAGLFLSIHKPSVAYYLLPARAWELAVGAVVAAGAIPQLRHPVLREAMPALGVAAILFSLFWISSDMVFPGWWALIPCLGAAMVIHGGGTTWMARRVLSARPVVLIGLMSYSLYLWHWPVLVSLRIRLASPDLSPAVAIAGMAASLLLAWLSWRFVEKPFRDREDMPKKKMLALLAAGTLALILVCGLSLLSGGFPNRLSERAHKLLAGATDIAHYQRCPEGSIERACEFGDSSAALKLLVVGDSQTPALLGAFDQLASAQGIRGTLYWHSACPLLDGAWREGDGYQKACFAFRQRVFQQIAKIKGLQAVVLVGSWQGQVGDGKDEAGHPLLDRESLAPGPVEARAVLARSLGRTLDRLAAQGLATIIIGSAPGAGFDVPRILALADLHTIKVPLTTKVEAIRPIHTEIDALLRAALAGRPAASYIPLWDLFCPGRECLLTLGDSALYADSGHLTARGVADFVSGPLVERVEAALDATAAGRLRLHGVQP